MTQGQILSSLYSVCKVPAVLGHCICGSQWNEILSKSPHDYYHLTKHSEGPCCFLQYNSTGVTLGGWGSPVSCLQAQLTPTQLSKLQPSKAVSLKERESTQRMQYVMDSPLKHGRDQVPAVTHAYNVQALQLLWGSLLWEVSSYGKQKAGGGENGVKVYFIPSARCPAKHTMPERSNSCSLLLQDLSSVAQAAWRSIRSTDR